MANQRESYWPTDFDVDAEITPLTILKEQAALLGERTKDLVEGRVQTKVEDGMEFYHSLYVIVPTPGNYGYFLLSVRYRPATFPIRIFDGTSDREDTVFDVDQFKDKLKEILSSDRVRKIVSTLLTYAMSPTSPWAAAAWIPRMIWQGGPHRWAGPAPSLYRGSGLNPPAPRPIGTRRG